MLFHDSETVELKEIIAFANCNGGKLYIGVKDDGTIVGIDEPDSISLQISNMVRDSIKQNVTMFVHNETIEEDEKNLSHKYSTRN